MNKGNSLTVDLGENLKNAVVHTLKKDLENINFSQKNESGFSSETSSQKKIATVPVSSVAKPSLRSTDVSQKKFVAPFSPAFSLRASSTFEEKFPEKVLSEEAPIEEKTKKVSISKSGSPHSFLQKDSNLNSNIASFKGNLSENFSQKKHLAVPNPIASPFLNEINRTKLKDFSEVETKETKENDIKIENQKSIPLHSEKKTVFPSILEKYRSPKILPQYQQKKEDFQNNIPKNSKEEDKLSVRKDGSLMIENIYSFGYILKKCFKIAFSVFIFLTIGFLSIYFWVTKASIESVLDKFIPQDFKAESVVPEHKGEKLPNFSLDSANYLSFDINNLGKEEIKEVISKKANEVLRSKASSPVEFVLTDKQNNPISFEFFSRKIGSPLLIETVGNYIGSDFSLFMQNEEGNIKLCLVIALKDNSETDLKNKLLPLEKDLLNEMDFIYLDYEKDFKNKEFSSSNYGNYGGRYINADSDKKLSLDYVVYKNYLILGSSFLVESSVLDLLFKPKDELK